VLAESQSKGQGRVQRSWSSKARGNVYTTIVLWPRTFARLAPLNFAIPLAVASACEQALGRATKAWKQKKPSSSSSSQQQQQESKSASTAAAAAVAPSSTACVGIKWPNDVWINGRKVCGIKVDSSIEQKRATVLAGIGINVNEDMAQSDVVELRTLATSLRMHCGGVPVSRELVLADVCNQLERLMLLPLSEILELFAVYDLLLGKVVTVMPKKKENTASHYAAVAEAYSTTGSLMVRKLKADGVTPDSSAQLIELLSEEVSLRPAAAAATKTTTSNTPAAAAATVKRSM
jgi:biotin-(acetyl-CoA carboxylase) ligase